MMGHFNEAEVGNLFENLAVLLFDSLNFLSLAFWAHKGMCLYAGRAANFLPQCSHSILSSGTPSTILPVLALFTAALNYAL
jgi:hypothetical protein